MLNPDTSRYNIIFSDEFYREDLQKKYNDYLFHLNQPIKDIKGLITESAQTLQIPGFSLNTLIVAGLRNLPKNPNTPISEVTTNVQFPGTAPLAEILTDFKVNITFRNNLINWLFFYEVFRGYYARQRVQQQFSIIVPLFDSNSVNIFNFLFSGCFITDIPPLEFSFNKSFGETLTIDLGIAFQKLDAQFNIPEYNKTNIKV